MLLLRCGHEKLLQCFAVCSVERLWSSNSSTEQQQYESQEESDEDLLHFPNLKREGDALQQQQQLMLQPPQEKHESQCE